MGRWISLSPTASAFCLGAATAWESPHPHPPQAPLVSLPPGALPPLPLPPPLFAGVHAGGRLVLGDGTCCSSRRRAQQTEVLVTERAHASQRPSQVLTAPTTCQPALLSVSEHGPPCVAFSIFWGPPPPGSLWSLIPSCSGVFDGLMCCDSQLDWRTLDIFEFSESRVQPGMQ